MRLKRLAIRFERSQHNSRLGIGKPGQNWFLFPEASRRALLIRVRTRNGFGQLRKRMHRRSPKRLLQAHVYRRNFFNAADLIPHHLQHWHWSVGPHPFAVTGNASNDRALADAFLIARFSPGYDKRCRHPLKVPLERPLKRLVEVVDIENQPAILRCERAKIANMRITAKLHRQAGIGHRGKIRRHHRHRSAKIPERRREHALVFDLDKRRNSTANRPLQQGESRRKPCFSRKL